MVADLTLALMLSTCLALVIGAAWGYRRGYSSGKRDATVTAREIMAKRAKR